MDEINGYLKSGIPLTDQYLLGPTKYSFDFTGDISAKVYDDCYSGNLLNNPLMTGTLRTMKSIMRKRHQVSKNPYKLFN